jgi:hypothetical protein
VIKRLVVLLLVAWLAGAQGQKRSQSISQDTDGVCSPAIVAGADVTFTCQVFDEAQQKMLSKVPALLDQLLKKTRNSQANWRSTRITSTPSVQ